MESHHDVVALAKMWGVVFYKCFRAARIPPWQLPIWAGQGVYLASNKQLLETTDKQWSFYCCTLPESDAVTH